jgi:hypothetical protein
MRLAIEITRVSTSKKGTVWIQAKIDQKLLPGEVPKEGEIYMCEYESSLAQIPSNVTATTVLDEESSDAI